MRYSDREVEIGGEYFSVEYPIKEAFVAKDRTIVLYDPDADKAAFGQFHNLVCLESNGNVAWVADLPTSDTGDCYYKIVSRNPLRVLSFKSYECEIDLDTGKIKSSKFSK